MRLVRGLSNDRCSCTRCLVHYFIIELLCPFQVQREPFDLTHCFPFVSSVSAFLWTARTKFHNEVAMAQFICKVTEMITWYRIESVGSVYVNDTVSTKIQEAPVQQFHGLGETQPGPKGGKAGHKNVRIRSSFKQRTYLISCASPWMYKMVKVLWLLDLHLIGVLPNLPHTKSTVFSTKARCPGLLVISF